MPHGVPFPHHIASLHVRAICVVAVDEVISNTARRRRARTPKSESKLAGGVLFRGSRDLTDPLASRSRMPREARSWHNHHAPARRTADDPRAEASPWPCRVRALPLGSGSAIWQIWGQSFGGDGLLPWPGGSFGPFKVGEGGEGGGGDS